MKKTLAWATLAILVLGPLQLRAETCSSSQTTDTGKGPAASVGKDGVAGTGWTGGTGGLMAGIENEKKGQNPDQNNPDIAKGLDPTKGVTNERAGPGNDKGPTSGPQPKC